MTETTVVPRSLSWEDVREGDVLPESDVNITPTLVIAGAIATRDFYPVHHDVGFAHRKGFKNIIMNLLTSGGLAAKFITDWSGPEAEIKKITQKVSVPCYAGEKLKMKGKVIAKRVEAGEHLVDVEYGSLLEDGVHASGIITIALPGKV